MPLNQFSGKQVRNLTLKDNHIAADAAIAESKLSINWASHYHNALATKLLVDYVQMNGVAVGAGAGDVVIPKGNPGDPGKISQAFAAGPNDYGVVDTYPILMRDAATGSPIAVNNKEVFGIISFDGTDYTISFNTGSVGSPTAVDLPAGIAAIDLQYMCRFNLDTVSESFAANEKFVDGMADVSDTANLLQIIKDVFLPGYTLDSDGNPNLAKPVLEVLSDETHGAVNTDVDAKTIIDEVVEARDSFEDIHARFVSDEGRILALENWKNTNNTRVHEHHDEYGQTAAEGSDYMLTTLLDTLKMTDFVSVYLNGARQYPGTNFTLIEGDGGNGTAAGKVAGIHFLGTLEIGWDVYIEAVIYNS